MADIPDTRENLVKLTPQQQERSAVTHKDEGRPGGSDRSANRYRDRPQGQRHEEDDPGIEGRDEGNAVEIGEEVLKPGQPVQKPGKASNDDK